MSVCNTLGANTLDVLLSLGMPWFIKCSLPQSQGGGQIFLTSEDLEFNCIVLACSVILLNIIAASTSYKMNRIFGVVCILSYMIVASLFIAVGMNVISIFSKSNLTTC